ncbi:hypothetical protein [Streptomyces sp. NPDC052012]|uniref:AAA family ATPase n=1 Tax=Streptomyces sp. NPDC052012 TaxID=3155051 RepID=UPI00344C03B6
MSDLGPALRAVAATGDRSIALGGDAINSLLVTGDNNTFFVGQYARLQDAYLSPAQLHRELELNRFTGRGWLLAQLDAAIARHDRGYVLIEAEAGMGKTTFVAWLARERGYVHHFVRLMPDPDDSGAALRNLSAQLIRAWDLETYATGGVLPPTADRPEFLAELLEAAAARRDALHPGEPIVLVVDGLNETTPAAGQNPLGLPARLPSGVFVVTTQRPVHIPFRIDVPREIMRIDPESEENRDDARAYLEGRGESDPLRGILERDGIPQSRFVDTLLAKSEGVWVYLHYVIAEIAAERLAPDRIDRLPTGLWHYYAQYWYDWQRRHEERWHELDLPVLSVIAAAAEPLSARLIAELAGTAHTGTVEDLLDNDWRPFLHADESGEDVLYRTFHDSLGEFLRGDVATEELTTAERSLARRLARATRQAHARTAERYLTAWGGLADGLPGLAEPGPERLDGGYGLRHVVDHLVGADRQDDLHTLLTLSLDEGPRPANLWFTVHRRAGEIAAYRRDVNVARNAVRLGTQPLSWMLQLRYVLITCSLNSQAEATPPALWSLLVRHGRMSVAEALTQAREIPTAEDRAEALTSLIDEVPAELREDVEREAMAAVRSVPDEFWRVGELWRLYHHVSAERQGELLSVVRSLADPYFQVVALRLLGVQEGMPTMSMPREGHGHEENLESPSGMAASAAFIEDYRRRRHQAAARLGQAGFSTGGSAPHESDDPAARYWRAHLLTLAAVDASGNEAARLVEAAYELGTAIDDRREGTLAWASLASMLRWTSGGRAVDTLADRIPAPAHRLALLIAVLATATEPDLREAAHRGALAALAAMPDDTTRSAVLTDLAPTLARCDAERVIRLTDAVDDVPARVGALLAAADCADSAEAERFARSVAALLAAADRPPGWVALLARAASHLPADALDEAAALTLSIPQDELRWAARCALGTRLCALGRTEQAGELADSVGGLWQGDLLYALADAHLEQGRAETALELAARIPYRTRHAEILARALPAQDTGRLLAEVHELTAGLDASSQVSVLARAAAAGSPSARTGLCEQALTLAQGIEDYYERSVALCRVTEALVTCGDIARASEVCADIPLDLLRADALTAVLRGEAPRVPALLAEQIAQLADRPARARVRATALHRALRDTPAGTGERTALALLYESALDDLAAGPRERLFASLPDLLEALAEHDGPAALRTLAEDLADIQSWWP